MFCDRAFDYRWDFVKHVSSDFCWDWEMPIPEEVHVFIGYGTSDTEVDE